MNTARPSDDVLERYRAEHKFPLTLGDVPEGCEVVTGDFWSGEFARHDRRRLASRRLGGAREANAPLTVHVRHVQRSTQHVARSTS